MTKVYFVVYFSICFYASYLLNNHHYTIAFLVFFFGIPVGVFWLHRHNRDKLLKKQELKKPTFYDDFKNDFSFLTIVAEKVTKAFKISIIWSFKVLFKIIWVMLKIIWHFIYSVFYGIKHGC